jgi:NADH-quinone oxidoreductase subunit C
LSSADRPGDDPQDATAPKQEVPDLENPTLAAEADREAALRRERTGADADQREAAEPPAPATPPGEELKSEGTDEDVPAGDPAGAEQPTRPEAEPPPAAGDTASAGAAAATPDATTPDQPATGRPPAEGDVAPATVDDVPTAEEPEPEPEPEPVDEVRAAVVEQLTEALGDGVVESHIRVGDDVWVRVRPEVWRQAAEVCRDRLGMTYFCFLSAVDWLPSPFGKSEDGTVLAADEQVEAAASLPATTPGYAGGESRFQLLARVYSTSRHLGVFLKCDVDEADPRVESWAPVYAGADWHERETWEMYGIDFAGHPHLVHIYLPGDFEGYPLRKDFPLLAREVKPWPGIVDVEPMPGDDAGDEAAAGAEGGA